MVIDGEWMPRERAFVAFDLWSHGSSAFDLGRCVYERRMHVLRSSPAPTFVGVSFAIKDHWSPGAPIPSTPFSTDGIIIHNLDGRLDALCTSLKWKPVHTVDLLSDGTGAMLAQGEPNPTHSTAPDCPVPPAGQVWECTFDGPTHVRPIKWREDKPRGNYLTVVREIHQASKAALTLDDVIAVLQSKTNAL